MTTATTSETIQIYRVYIKTTPEAIWEAITKPEWTVQYGYAPLVEYELRSGGAFRAHANEGMKALGCPDVISDGEVDRVRPASQAGPDVAHDDDARAGGRGVHPAHL